MPKKPNYKITKSETFVGPTTTEVPSVIESIVSEHGSSRVVTVPRTLPKGTRVRIIVIEWPNLGVKK